MRRVNPSVYTTNYYLTDCNGYREFKQTWGKKLEPRLKKIIQYIPLKSSMKVLDIGCGRGELSFWAANHCSQVVGIDYSVQAIKLALQAKKKHPFTIQKKLSFLQMDAKKINFSKNCFDAVFLVEILEHLYSEEQKLVFKQILKVLKPGGFIFIHTSPSRWFNDYTYPYWCYPLSSLIVKLWNRLAHSQYPNLTPPNQVRTASHKIMHVNEPDYFSLRRLFNQYHLSGSIRSTNITVNKPLLSWKDQLFNLIVYLHPISNIFPLNLFWGNDFLAVLRRKGGHAGN